jgi:hypothetical protein
MKVENQHKPCRRRSWAGGLGLDAPKTKPSVPRPLALGDRGDSGPQFAGRGLQSSRAGLAKRPSVQERGCAGIVAGPAGGFDPPAAASPQRGHNSVAPVARLGKTQRPRPPARFSGRKIRPTVHGFLVPGPKSRVPVFGQPPHHSNRTVCPKLTHCFSDP